MPLELRKFPLAYPQDHSPGLLPDVELITTLMERIFGLGTVICYTGDTTHPKLVLSHIRNSKAIKNYILEASEQARMRRRTLNTLDIGAEAEISEGDFSD